MALQLGSPYKVLRSQIHWAPMPTGGAARHSEDLSISEPKKLKMLARCAALVIRKDSLQVCTLRNSGFDVYFDVCLPRLLRLGPEGAIALKFDAPSILCRLTVEVSSLFSGLIGCKENALMSEVQHAGLREIGKTLTLLILQLDFEHRIEEETIRHSNVHPHRLEWLRMDSERSAVVARQFNAGNSKPATKQNI